MYNISNLLKKGGKLAVFTGVVEAVGHVVKMRAAGSIVNLQIEAPFSGELKIGQSICVMGACLSVVSYDNTCFNVEMMNETVKRTVFSSLLEKNTGMHVNLERALRVGDRLDGHFVLGHVDGVGTVHSLKNDKADTYTLKIVAAPEIMCRIVSKGSVTLDGVSLTVIDSTNDYFSVGLIPITLSNSTLGRLKAGDKLNIETDIIGKYVLTKLLNVLNGNFPDTKSIDQVSAIMGNKSSISLEKLMEMGW